MLPIAQIQASGVKSSSVWLWKSCMDMNPKLWGRFPDLVCFWCGEKAVSILFGLLICEGVVWIGWIWFGFHCILIFFSYGVVLLDGILEVNIIQMTSVQIPPPQPDSSLMDFVVTCHGTWVHCLRGRGQVRTPGPKRGLDPSLPF